MVLGKLDSYTQKNETGLLSCTIYKNKLKWIKYLNMRPETIKTSRKKHRWEFQLWLSGLQTWLVSMRTHVQSLASLSGLRIHHCCELQCRLQLQLRSHIAVAVAMAVASSCSSDLIPSLGIPIYHSTALKSKKKKKTKKREREAVLSPASILIFLGICILRQEQQKQKSGLQNKKLLDSKGNYLKSEKAIYWVEDDMRK